jgi:hypothetical protein
MSCVEPILTQPVPLVFPVEFTGVMKPDPNEIARVGLCATCAHRRLVRNDRGSIFYQCLRALTDARYAQYSRLPVLSCAGYEAPEAGEKGPAPETSS